MKKNNDNKCNKDCYNKTGIVFYKKHVNKLHARGILCIQSYSEK